MLPSTILCDFDGTITLLDTNEVILDKYSTKESWQRDDQLFLDGKITLEECMTRQFSHVKATASELLQTVDSVGIREGFKELVNYCTSKGIELVVVSAGLDFIIRKKLADVGVNLKIISPKAKITSTGIQFEYPHFQGKGPNFKAQFVDATKKRHRPVHYIGDGESDLAAASLSDFVYAIRGSRLADFCSSKQIPFKAIRDFNEVLTTLRTEARQ